MPISECGWTCGLCR